MIVIAGLGNPGSKYDGTKHNVGFRVIDKLACDYNINMTKLKHKAFIGEGMIKNKKVMLVKPQTYMNLSGESIREWLAFYKLTPKDLVVIYDDMDVEKGTIKIRKQGGPGSHNGMKSVVHEIGTTDFARIRIGLGEPEEESGVDFVIGPLKEEQYNQLKPGIEKATDAIETILKEGIDRAMNQFN